MSAGSVTPSKLSWWETTDQYWVVLARSLFREAFLRIPTNRRHVILVNEFPKSGGTWFCRMLKDLTGWDFPDNRLPTQRRSIIKQHSIADYAINKRVIVWRDPRDVYVSLYHHVFFVHEDYPFNRVSVRRARQRYQFADYEDLQSNLPSFVESQFDQPVTPRFNWCQFAAKWIEDQNAVHVKYEDLRQAPFETISRVSQSLDLGLTPDKIEHVLTQHDISKHKTTSGERRSFVRRGKVGGYTDDLPQDTIQLIEERCGTWMKKLGYLR